MTQPLVSVVTPFHNTADYLAECIESVLAQSYSNFEYILVDNCSTDGAGGIAKAYARRDSRIRTVRRPEFLSQVRNYNLALEEISRASNYCKIVQADDYIFPSCLQLMVGAFEQHQSAGLVSSYWLKGNEVRGNGFPYPTPVLCGRETARLYLRTGLWVFGSPTAVMYRSSMIKKDEPFYDETATHEDTEKCMQILKDWDFGFVHQVLSFSRADNKSISSAVRDFNPNSLDRYIIVQRHASEFLSSSEAAALRKRTKRDITAFSRTPRSEAGNPPSGNITCEACTALARHSIDLTSEYKSFGSPCGWRQIQELLCRNCCGFSNPKRPRRATMVFNFASEHKSLNEIIRPLISVAMVIRNVELFLAESIESILEQTLTNFEFIIVDFGSTDGSKRIASRYGARDGRIKLHEIPACTLAEARNAACQLAEGQYIAVMDSDDVAVPDRLRWEFEFMEKHPAVGLLGGATEWIDAEGKSLSIDRFPTQDYQLRAAFSEGCPFCQPTVLFRKDAFSLVGGYRSVFGQSEDYDLWLRISEHYEVANLEQVVLRYRIHPHQISIRRRKEQTLSILAAQLSARERGNGNQDPLNTCEEITTSTLASFGVSEAQQERKIVTGYRHWIRRMDLAGDHSIALKEAIEVVQTDWRYVERWQIADLYVIISGLYWKQKKFLSSVLAAARAVAMRPKIIGRPLKPMLARLGLT